MGWFDSMVGAGRGFAGRQSSTPYSTGRQSAAGGYGQRQSPTGGYSSGFGGATPYGMNRQSPTPYPYSGGSGGGGFLGKIGGAFGLGGFGRATGGAASGMGGAGGSIGMYGSGYGGGQPQTGGYAQQAGYGQAQPVAPLPAAQSGQFPTNDPAGRVPGDPNWGQPAPEGGGKAYTQAFVRGPDGSYKTSGDPNGQWYSRDGAPIARPDMGLPVGGGGGNPDDYLYPMPDGSKVPYIPFVNPYETGGGLAGTPEVNGGGQMIAPGDPGWQQLDDKRPTLGGIQGGGLTEMESPDGVKRRLPPNQVPFYRGRGAREV